MLAASDAQGGPAPATGPPRRPEPGAPGWRASRVQAARAGPASAPRLAPPPRTARPRLPPSIPPSLLHPPTHPPPPHCGASFTCPAPLPAPSLGAARRHDPRPAAPRPASSRSPSKRPLLLPHLPPPRASYLVGVCGQEDVEFGFCRSIHLGPERGPRAAGCPAPLRGRRKMGFTALRCLSHRSFGGGGSGRGKRSGEEGPEEAGREP